MKTSFFVIVFAMASIVFAKEFKVALPLLPEYNPYLSQSSVGNYVGTQMYFPLFEFDSKGNNATSRFFDLQKTRSISKKFDVYEFCLKENLKFSDGTPIGIVDFEASLKMYAKMYPNKILLKTFKATSKKCALVELNKSTKGLFSKMTGPSSTIVKASQVKQNYPVGLGHYKLTAATKSTVGLELTDSKNSEVLFDKIRFDLIESHEAQLEGYDDINQMPPSIFRKNKIGVSKIKAPSLKVYSMVINLKKLEERKSVVGDLLKIDWADLYKLDLEKNNRFIVSDP